VNRRDRELDKELRFHLESLFEQNLAAAALLVAIGL